MRLRLLVESRIRSITLIVVNALMAIRANKNDVCQGVIEAISVLMMNLKKLRALIPSAKLALLYGAAKMFCRRLISEPVSEPLGVWIVRAAFKSMPIGVRSHLLDGLLGVGFAPKRVPIPAHVCGLAFLRAIPNLMGHFFRVFNARLVNIKLPFTCLAVKISAGSLSPHAPRLVFGKLNPSVLIHG